MRDGRRAVAVSPDSRQLATCGNDLMVRLWSCADGSLIREFAGHGHHVYSVAFHPGGRCLASGDLRSTPLLTAITRSPGKS